MEKQVITKEAIRQVLLDYWSQYKTNWWQAMLAFLMPAIGTIFVAYLPPLLIGKIINLFASTGKISLHTSAKYIFLFAVLWLIGEGLWRLGLHYLIKIETVGTNFLLKKAFTDLSSRDYSFYANNFVGSLSKKSFAYTRNFESFTDTLVFNIFSRVMPIFFVIYILWGYSFWIPLTLIACLLLVIVISIPIIKKRVTLVTEKHFAGSRLVGRLSDSLTNMLAIKSFAREKSEKATYGIYIDDFTDKFSRSANFQNQKYDMVISPIYVATNVIGLVVAIYFSQKLNLQTGSIVVVFSYFAQVTRIFWDINQIYRHLESSVTEAAEFTQMFLLPPYIQNSSDAKSLIIRGGEIEFKNVNFGYCEVNESKDTDVKDSFLSEFNFKINSNQKVGLVGPSGGGKTTITKLLLRFVDCSSGDILIDGQELKKVTQESLRQAISYVPQEPLLFHRTLFENIAYGNEKATEKEVIEAAKLAHAHDFIKKLPDGYQTLVGERGIKLSGGQRQRVAIARALLKKAPILVLDEATSSLDSESEKYIQEGLWELMKNKTALVIAHRLSTIKHLDRIIVLEDGKIVQDGTHDELIKQGGLYGKLWEHQSGSVEFTNKL